MKIIPLNLYTGLMKVNRTLWRAFIVFTEILIFFCVYGQNKLLEMPEWKQGYLEIHHLSTGKGSSTFIILPDGTTMLIDAGDVGNTSNEGASVEKEPSAAQTIAKYINKMTPKLLEPNIDYALLTNFNFDHIGNTGLGSNSNKSSNDYPSGIAELVERSEEHTSELQSRENLVCRL